MKPASRFVVVLVTAPDMKVARKLASASLEKRLVACANILPKIESHYWWQGRIDRSNEVMLLLKTTAAKLAALEKLIVSKHPYDTPEFIVLKLRSGNKRYLDWLMNSVAKR